MLHWPGSSIKCGHRWNPGRTARQAAADSVSDYLRARAHEDGFARRIAPPVPVTVHELDRQMPSQVPYTVPFGEVPVHPQLAAPRYRVKFTRMMSHRFSADVENLVTYDADLRDVFNDVMLADITAKEDIGATMATPRALGRVCFRGSYKGWKSQGDRTMLMEVAVVMNPTKRETEEGASATMVVPPEFVMAENDNAAALQVIQNHPELAEQDANRLEVLVRPFA